MTTTLLDCAEIWDRLSPEQQRELGAAAVLFVISDQASGVAKELDSPERSAFFEIAFGVALEAIERTALTSAITAPGLPDLRPFGVQQCRQCGCIEEVACQGGCSWAEPDLCTACLPVMAEAVA